MNKKLALFFIVSSIIIKYPDPTHFVWYMSVVLSTYFSIDVIKIFLADKVKSKITDDKVFVIRKVVGICLLIFGIIIGLKGFGFFQEIDQRIENKLKLEERI